MSSLPWIILTLVAIIAFGYFEHKALQPNAKITTLSMFVYSVGAKFPLAIWFCGVFAGGLAVHFFWHWCPVGSISMGMLSLPNDPGIFWKP